MSLIILEGADGTGKTTLAELLARNINNAEYYAFPGREPGTLGEQIYRLHHSDVPMCQESLQLLHITAHINALRMRIIPWLVAGKTVVMDRFYWSTYVYGMVYGVPPSFLNEIINLERQFWADWVVDSCLFLMHREEPFNKTDDPKSAQRWGLINRLYLECFNQYDQVIFNRFRIENQSTIDEALAQIMSKLAAL